MAEQLIYSDVSVDNSITNPLADTNSALDNTSPFSFLDYLKYTNGTYSPAEYNIFYTSYLKKWSTVKSEVTPTNIFIAEQYSELLKDISLNFTSNAEKRFLTNIDFSNPLDLDIALPFYTKKIKEIILFYKQKRDTGTFVIERNKIKGTNTSLERCIYELITQYVFSDDNIAGSSELNYNIDKIKQSLEIDIDEFIDVYSNYFDLPRTPVDESVIRTELYTFNTNAIESDYFFDKDEEVTKMIFGSSIYLSEIPIAVNVQLNYNPVCSPINPLTTLVSDDDKDQIGASQRVDLKKRLFQKYLGSDFYYLSTNGSIDTLSGMFIKADNPSGNLLNMQTADIAGVEAGQLESLRSIGLFFKPDKQGILKVGAKSFTYEINRDILEPDRIYIFPDPSVYGNVSLNAQSDYPLIYTFDITPEIRNRSNSIAYGDPKINSDEQSIAPYYSRQQNKAQTELFTDLSDLWNLGIIRKWQTDIYGNQYAIFKDQYGQYFETPQSDTENVVKCLVMDGHLFFDQIEGYNFDYSKYEIEPDGFTIRTGLSAHTVENENSPSFILSSDPLFLNFRQFYPYQSCNTFADGSSDDIKYATLYTCGTLMNEDMTFLPDPMLPTLSAFPGAGYYYYDIYMTGAVGSLNPPHIALTDVPELSANLLYSLENYLSSGDAIAYTGGTLSDNIVLTDHTDNSLFIDIVEPGAQTILSPLSGNGSEYHDISYYNALTGTAYIRQVGSTASIALSSALQPLIAKYNADVQNEVNNKLIDFEIVYDTIIMRSKNTLVFDKLVYSETGYTRPSTKNTFFRLDESNNFNKFSNYFFNETTNTITFAIMSQFSELSGTIQKIVYPSFYRYEIANNQTTKIWPTDTYSQVKALSSLYVTSGVDTLSANIVTIGDPKLVYNSKNDIWKLTLVGKDLNNFPYLYDYTIRERNSLFEAISSKCYVMTGKTVQTSIWSAPSAQYVTFGLFNHMTLTNQGIQ